MDMTPYTPPAAPDRPRSHTTSVVVGVIIIVILIVLAGYGAYRYFGPHNASGKLTFPANARITLSANDLPAHNAQVVDLSHMSLAPDHIASQGTQNIYAEVLTKTAGYYLISGPSARQSTLYKLNLADPNAGLQQLSTSTSEKIDLSVNEPADVAAYTVQVGGTPHVVSLNMKTGVETDLGAGTHPHVLASGLSVLFQKRNTIVSEEIGTTHTYTLATTTANAPFAVDSYHSLLAVYDPAKNKVTTYSIQNSDTQTLQFTQVTPGYMPGALFYDGGTLLMARMQQDTLILNSIDGKQQVPISAPGFSLSGFSLSVL